MYTIDETTEPASKIYWINQQVQPKPIYLYIYMYTFVYIFIDTYKDITKSIYIFIVCIYTKIIYIY